ncbi:MAG: sugar phosphate nucleotidyltransferase [Candidatus Dojkabacteria bacterium]
MDKKISLLVLAAGMGSRYGGLKQMEGFGPNEETIIDYSIYDAIKAGIEKFVFIIREEMEDDFKELFVKKYEKRIDIQYIFQSLDMVPDWYKVNPERVKPLGTGHALLVAKDIIKEPFLVINGDDFYGNHSFKVSADFLKKECTEELYAITTYRLENVLSEHGTVKRGICKAEDNYLKEIDETFEIAREKDGKITGKSWNGDRVRLRDNDLVSMNMFCLHHTIFDSLERRFEAFLKDNEDELEGEFLLSMILSNMINDGEVKFKVLEALDEWFGVTYPEDGPVVREKIKDLVEKSVYPSNLEI